MNIAGWMTSGTLLLAGVGCASPAESECRMEIKALQEAVRDLQRRVEALDGKSADPSLLPVDTTLLVRFPPPQWSQERLSEILKREIVKGEFRTAEEAEFIEKFPDWKRALERSREPGAK